MEKSVSKRTLTLEQQEFVEKHHNLIYDFAFKRNLQLEEYYGLLAIGLCKAASTYNNPKYEFSTYAFKVMSNEVNMYWEHVMSKSVIPKDMVLYGDNKIKSEDNTVNGATTFFDTLVSKDNSPEDVLHDIECIELMGLLTDIEKTVVKYMLEGIKQKKIAEILGCSQQNISGRILKSIKTKWIAYLSV